MAVVAWLECDVGVGYIQNIPKYFKHVHKSTQHLNQVPPVFYGASEHFVMLIKAQRWTNGGDNSIFTSKNEFMPVTGFCRLVKFELHRPRWAKVTSQQKALTVFQCF